MNPTGPLLRASQFISLDSYNSSGRPPAPALAVKLAGFGQAADKRAVSGLKENPSLKIVTANLREEKNERARADLV